MTSPSDIDDLVRAIESLRADPWLSVLIPTLSGVIGVIAGFFLSVAKGAVDRRTARRDEIIGGIRERRQAAVDVFSTEAKWISRNIGFTGSQQEWAPHQHARKGGPELFDKTGKVSDDIIAAAARHYLQVLDSTPRTYARPDHNGGVVTLKQIGSDVITALRSEVDGVRAAAQRWVDEDRDSRWLETLLTKSSERVGDFRDKSEDASPPLAKYF